MRIILKLSCPGTMKLNGKKVMFTEASADNGSNGTYKNVWFAGKIIDTGELVKLEFEGNVLNDEDLTPLRTFLTND